MKVIDKHGDVLLDLPSVPDSPLPKLFGVDLSAKDLSDALLSGSDLRSACLYMAFMFGADLTNADLEGADLRGADLVEVSLCGANPRSAQLGPSAIRVPTKLYGADLRDANLQGADLSGCGYDSLTQFSADFDPAERGMFLNDGEWTPPAPANST